jgi:hypothetical protein
MYLNKIIKMVDADLESHEILKDISKFQQEIKDGNLILTYKIYNINRYKQELDESKDILYLIPKITYLSNQDIETISLTHSKIINCYIYDECSLEGKNELITNELITNELNYRKILIDVWKHMATSKIIQNTTMNIKLGEHKTKGYNYVDNLKFSFQQKDSLGTFKEICKMVNLNNYTIDIQIRLQNGKEIGYKN